MIAALALLPATTLAEPHRYELDPAHTVVSFTVGHIGYSDTLGIFREVEGAFTYDMETQTLSDLEVRVATPSVDTFHEARDGHVRNADFLDVSAHPTMTFTADGGDPAGDASGTVTGDLMLLGQTLPLTLDVTLNKAEVYPFGHQRFTLGISATGSLERSAFGMDYGVANGLVGDRVDIVIETEAVRAE
ncbi:MAG: YceI family protein [Pseudomonadota bacterium]